MKRIFELVAPHWRILIIGALCSAVVSAINGGFAWVVKTVIDDVFIKGDKAVLTMFSVGILIAFIVRGFFTFAQNYLMFKVGAKIVRDVRNSLYRQMVRLPLSRYGSDSRGVLMSKIISDAQTLQELIAFRVRDFFVSIGTIVLLVGVALYRRWDLTILALVVLPFAFVIVGKIGRRLKKVTRQAQNRMAIMTESLAEGLSGLKVIKSFCREEREIEKFMQKTDGYFVQYVKSTKLLESTSLLMEVVSGLGVSAIIFYGGFLVANHEITFGDFFSFMTAIMMIFTPAKRLANVSNGFQQAHAFIGRIDDVLDAAPEPQGPKTLESFKSTIKFEGVRFRHAGREDYAINDLNLEVRKGEIIALVGRSGSGKTTLIDLLARFYRPQEGRILIDGTDINEYTMQSLRSQIGIVSQEVFLFSDTVRENIAFGRSDATTEMIESAAKAAYAHDFIMEMPEGYDTQVGEGGDRLSGGQRQRLSIARAILKDPPILILDEATSSLDTQSEVMVQQALDNIIATAMKNSHDAAKTIFVIAHRLSTIKNADRIVVLDQGRVVETGSHDELLKGSGIYRRLYSLQHGSEGEGGDEALL